MDFRKTNTLNFEKANVWLLVFVVIFLVTRLWQHFFWNQHTVSSIYEEHFFRLVLVKKWGLYNIETYRRAYLLDFVRKIGWIYPIALVSLLFLKKAKWFPIIMSIVIAIAIFMMPYSKLILLRNHYNLLMEYFIQALSMLILVFAVTKLVNRATIILITKIAIALTFIGHGLYALNLYPIPSNFMFMTTQLTIDNEVSVSRFLILMGILDLIVAILLFLPNKRLQQIALLYCIAWGFATATARIACYFSPDTVLFSLNRWLPETTYRLLHGGLPLFLLLFMSAPRKDIGEAVS